MKLVMQKKKKNKNNTSIYYKESNKSFIPKCIELRFSSINQMKNVFEYDIKERYISVVCLS